MFSFLTQFADEAASDGNIFSTLGIDWMTLILQAVAFLILLFILIKFIYPPILAMLDRHDKTVEDSIKAAQDAQKKADESQTQSAKLLEEAHVEADDIIATAKTESANIVAAAEDDAVKRADAIIASAKADLDREVEMARQTLRGETINLVAAATEKVINSKIDSADEKLIKNALKEGK